MKVLQINSVCGVGSTGRIAVDLYKTLVENGHESMIAFGRNTALGNVNNVKIGSNIDNYIHVAKTRIFDKHGFGSTKATKEFIKTIEEYNPDIIHLHNIHGYYINIEILFNYLKERNKPVVWTLHDCWTFTGHCAYFEYDECDKWKSQCSKCSQKNVYPTSILKDNSRWNYNKKKELFTSLDNINIVSPSQWLSRLVQESFLGKYNVHVINNGIDLETFKPMDSNFRKSYDLEDKFIVLGVASVWEERKGFKYLVELSEKLNDDYRIVVVGVTENQKSKLPKNIIGITRTNNVKELAELYSSADVFFNPTLEDNFPTTNLEALACGTPVITFNTGGSVESINEECGVIVEQGNVEETVKAIEKVRDSSMKGLPCLKRSKLFNKHDRYMDYMSLYERILR